jgi:hypothetical protein
MEFSVKYLIKEAFFWKLPVPKDGLLYYLLRVITTKY